MAETPATQPKPQGAGRGNGNQPATAPNPTPNAANGADEPIVTPPGTAKAATGDGPAHYAFCVEIAGPRNENLVCPFDRQKARGRFSKDGFGSAEPGEALRKMPTIPGICFLVNTAQRMVRRFDPMGQPANSNLLKKVSRIMGQMQETDGLQAKPEETKVWTDCTDEELKNWVFWLRRQYDLKLCAVVRGEVPTFEQIKAMPGDFRVGSFDQGAGAGSSVKSSEMRYRPPARVGKDAFEYEPDSEPVVGIEGADDDDE